MWAPKTTSNWLKPVPNSMPAPRRRNKLPKRSRQSIHVVRSIRTSQLIQNCSRAQLDLSFRILLTTSTNMRTRISVFLITLSGLILEVGLTRIYSASIWYHFAFVAISVALLGWGLGGFTVHLLKQRVRLSMETAALVTLLYAGAIPLCLWLLAW